MNSNILIMLMFLIIFSSVAFSEDFTQPLPDAQKLMLSTEDTALVNAENHFGLNLFRAIVSETAADENIFVSPLSISMALGMILNGAAAETRDQMESVLELKNFSQQQINDGYLNLVELLTQSDKSVILEIANSIWYRDKLTLDDEFITRTRKYFKAELRGLNFDNPVSAATINNWVDESTHGKIKKIVGQIDPSTIIYLINAIYFKGTWTHQFDESETHDDRFKLAGGSNAPCKLMTRKARFDYFETAEFQAIDLPYGNGNFRMTLFLPKDSSHPDSLIRQMNIDKFNRWLSRFQEKKVYLELPKFKLEYQLSLNNVLKSLGITYAFDPDQANLKRMYQGSPNAFISEALHKSFIEVNEKGTEAAAVTSVTIGITSISHDNVVHMKVDHPFLFFIRDNQSRAVLFAGKISNPNR